MAFAHSAGDSCLNRDGGFSIKLIFWWHILWPDKIQKRTKLSMNDNKNGKLISINVLKYVSIIINYCADLTVFLTSSPTGGPYPVLLNLADGLSAIHWTNHCLKVSLAGRALGQLFYMLLINSPLGINAKWLSTIENVIPDKILGSEFLTKLVITITPN